MSYYTSPAGDYKTYGYAGDPGFLSSLWKGVKKVAKVGLAYYTGGIAGAAMASMGGGKPQPPMQLPAPQAGRGLRTVQGIPVGGSLTMPGGMMFSGQTMIPTGTGRSVHSPGAAPVAMGPGMVPSGWHYAKDGSGRLVRNRRMNVANPRALRRAMRRAQGFEKLARRTINFNKRVRAKRRTST